jgi:hypothetical protein
MVQSVKALIFIEFGKYPERKLRLEQKALTLFNARINAFRKII